jgi:hypothetical protein
MPIVSKYNGITLGGFNPVDEESVYEALRVLTEKLSKDEPYLLQWIGDKIWEEHNKAKKRMGKKYDVGYIKHPDKQVI